MGMDHNVPICSLHPSPDDSPDVINGVLKDGDKVGTSTYRIISRKLPVGF